MSFMPVLIMFALLAGFLVASIAWTVRRGLRRRDALAETAGRLGLEFSDERDEALVAHFGFLNRHPGATKAYAQFVLRGAYRNQRVMGLDYHFQTEGGDKTQHFSGSAYILKHEGDFPAVEIYPRSLLHRAAQAAAADDLRFESIAFSDAFVVKSNDRRFAYAVCHPRMMELLLNHCDFQVEIEGNYIAICYDRPQSPDEVQPRLDALVAIRELMPEHLYAQ